MSAWNMPPGVSTNDIPGNEPAREATEVIAWIHVEQRLPDTWIDVLCWDEAIQQVAIRFWDGTGWIAGDGDEDMNCIVNYWADMPRGPEGAL